MATLTVGRHPFPVLSIPVLLYLLVGHDVMTKAWTVMILWVCSKNQLARLFAFVMEESVEVVTTTFNLSNYLIIMCVPWDQGTRYLVLVLGIHV